MQYNDYPEEYEQSVVEKLNSQYSSNEVDSQNIPDVLHSLNDNIRELKFNDLLTKVASCLEKVLDWLQTIRLNDRKNGERLNGYINDTIKQKEVILGYVLNYNNNNDTHKPKKRVNFHNCCVQYSLCEFELIQYLLQLCAEQNCVDTRCFYDMAILRLQVYQDVFRWYTA